MLRTLSLAAAVSLSVGAYGNDDAGSAPTTLATIDANAPATTQRVRDAAHQMLLRLASSGALGAHPESVVLAIDEPAQRAINLGLLVDATSAARARDGLHVLGATPGSTAERLGVQPGDVVVAVNGRSLRDLGADTDGRALAAEALKTNVDALPDGAALNLDVLRNGSKLTLNGPVQGLTLPALRLTLAAAATAAVADASAAAPTAGCGRIMLRDLAPRQQQLYGATILLVDGTTPGPHGAPNYRVAAGTHELLVSERIPTEQIGAGEFATLRNDKPKPLTITVKPDTTVFIAAHLNLDKATQLGNGEYWNPVMWKEMVETCR